MRRGEREGEWEGEKVRREGSKRVTKAIRENHKNRGGGGVCGVESCDQTEYNVAPTEPSYCKGRPYLSHIPPLQVPSCGGGGEGVMIRGV